MTKYTITFLILLVSLSNCNHVYAKRVVYDVAGMNVGKFFSESNTCYVISNVHIFNETLLMPKNCEVQFRGGRLSGRIVFANTFLSGNVNLKGSSISGELKNKRFNASWLCSMDGKTDDAPCINEIISLCNNVFFPKGQYRLVKPFNPEGLVPKEQISSINTHIGINKSGVHLEGETGTVFITDKPLSTICIFSQPYQIENNISNISIDSIEFIVCNDGSVFHDYKHTIKTIGVNGLIIENCIFRDFWSDAICLSHYFDTPETGERTRNQNVKILHNKIVGGDHHNNRNGISIVGGINVLIKGNIIKNTSRKDMPGGVDIEPNNSAYTTRNIRIENNYFEGIKGGGGAICVVSPVGGSIHNITIKGNRVYNSSTGVFIYLKSNGITDSYKILNNYIDGNTRPYRFEGSGTTKEWKIKGNTFERPCKQDIPGDIQVENLVMKNNKKKV